MRIILLAVFAVFISVVGYFSYGFLLELDSRIQQREQVEGADFKAVASLLGTTAFRFDQIVIGPGRTDEEILFRSQVAPTPKSIVARSAYGVIRRNCAQNNSETTEQNCFSLVELYVDGDAVDPWSERPPAELALETSPSVADATSSVTDPTSEVVDTTKLETDLETITISDEPSPALIEDNAPQPETSHIVQRALVNARSGPSTRSLVIAQLPVGTRLSLIDSQEAWGWFVVLNGASADLEAWIAFSVLNPA